MKARCEHLLCRSWRHPTGDLPCGTGALLTARQVGGESDAHPFNVCGTHANYWRRRGYIVEKIPGA